MNDLNNLPEKTAPARKPAAERALEPLPDDAALAAFARALYTAQTPFGTDDPCEVNIPADTPASDYVLDRLTGGEILGIMSSVTRRKEWITAIPAGILAACADWGIEQLTRPLAGTWYGFLLSGFGFIAVLAAVYVLAAKAADLWILPRSAAKKFRNSLIAVNERWAKVGDRPEGGENR